MSVRMDSRGNFPVYSATRLTSFFFFFFTAIEIGLYVLCSLTVSSQMRNNHVHLTGIKNNGVIFPKPIARIHVGDVGLHADFLHWCL